MRPVCHITGCSEVGDWQLDYYSGSLPRRKEEDRYVQTIIYCTGHYQMKAKDTANRMSNIKDLRKPYSTYLDEFEKELWS